ncbi:MAG: hypothetical protein SFW66_09035 [Gammaproteobacteria bacterium]|nr:hypothetical protein [Gammaproteobacteria bacterium]
MSSKVMSKPRRDVLRVERKNSAVTAMQGQTWFESSAAFILRDAFGRVNSVNKFEVVRVVLKNERHAFPYSAAV